MKLLLFSDLHCDADAARALVERAHRENVDVIVGAGDFAIMRRGARITVEILRAIACPAVVVPGNGESVEELAEACQDWPSVHVLHGSGVEIENTPFFGLGGGVPITPFGAWSYDFSEDEASELLADCPRNGIFVSHSPPRGILDRTSRAANLGSSAVRRTIERCQPQLVVCGHIHDCGGRHERLSDTGTVVVNAGPRGVIWELSSARSTPQIE